MDVTDGCGAPAVVIRGGAVDIADAASMFQWRKGTRSGKRVSRSRRISPSSEIVFLLALWVCIYFGCRVPNSSGQLTTRSVLIEVSQTDVVGQVHLTAFEQKTQLQHVTISRSDARKRDRTRGFGKRSHVIWFVWPLIHACKSPCPRPCDDFFSHQLHGIIPRHFTLTSEHGLKQLTLQELGA